MASMVLPQRHAQGFMNHSCSPGLSLDSCIEDYNTPGQALKYEENSVSVAYRAPIYCAQMLAGLLAQTKHQAKVLDAAAGPGQVGVQLNLVGFRDIHAHDGSWAMLDVCRQKGIYSHFVCSIIKDTEGLPIADGTYDAVVTSGAVLENHLPPSSQAEFARVTKPGGHVVMAYSFDILNTSYGQDWCRETQRMVSERVWDCYAKLIIPEYQDNMEGVVEIFRVK